MAYRQDWINYIRQHAPRYNLDPRAVLAVASSEGLSGAVGDSGTSYGPFQLHVGGALPQGRTQAWAESPAGMDYALREIGKVAGGMQGQAAVNAIVNKFERPANPGGEVQRAWGAYNQFAPGGAPGAGVGAGASATTLASPAAPVRRGTAPTIFSPKLVATLNQGARVLYHTKKVEEQAQGLPGHTAEVLPVGQQVPRFIPMSGMPQIPKQPNAKGAAPATSALGEHVVQFAAKQIGQPYVWGGESRKEGGFDCSGLVDAALRAAGVNLPGRLTTYSAMNLGHSVKGKALRPGDMVIVEGGKHMVLYAGGGRVIAAPHTGTNVQYQPLSRFRGGIVDVRRI